MRRTGPCGRPRPLSRHAVRAGRSIAARFMRSTPSTSRSRGCATSAREPLPGEIRLQWWSDVLRGERAERRRQSGRGGAAARLSATICRLRPLCRSHRGAPFDLYDEPMATLADLEAYAQDIVRACLRLAAQILGAKRRRYREPAGIAVRICCACCVPFRSTPRGASFTCRSKLLARHGVSAERYVRRQRDRRICAPRLRIARTRPRAILRQPANLCRRRRPPSFRRFCRSPSAGSSSTGWSFRLRPLCAARNPALAAAMADLARGAERGAHRRLTTFHR